MKFQDEIYDIEQDIKYWQREVDRNKKELEKARDKLSAKQMIYYQQQRVAVDFVARAQNGACKKLSAQKRLVSAKAFLKALGVRWYCDKRKTGVSLKPIWRKTLSKKFGRVMVAFSDSHTAGLEPDRYGNVYARYQFNTKVN